MTAMVASSSSEGLLTICSSSGFFILMNESGAPPRPPLSLLSTRFTSVTAPHGLNCVSLQDNFVTDACLDSFGLVWTCVVVNLENSLCCLLVTALTCHLKETFVHANSRTRGPRRARCAALCCVIATFNLISNCDKKWGRTKRGQTPLNAFNSLFLLRQETISNSRDE